MWIHNINPILAQIGIIQVRWYGVIYALGFLVAIWWLSFVQKKGKEKLGLSQDDVWDLALYLIIGVLIGARLFEVFWEPAYYLSNPTNFFRFWQGGMSFHGGFVGVVASCWLFCKKKDINFWRVADVLSIPAILALAFGRIANFINGELWGRAWDGAWCVNFKNTGGGDVCRHPSVLYAAAKRFAVFGWLAWLHFQRQLSFTPGFIFWNFVFWEGLGRIVVDFYRADVMWHGFTVGQWLSGAMVIIAAGVFVKQYKEDWRKLLR